MADPKDVNLCCSFRDNGYIIIQDSTLHMTQTTSLLILECHTFLVKFLYCYGLGLRVDEIRYTPPNQAYDVPAQAYTQKYKQVTTSSTLSTNTS